MFKVGLVGFGFMGKMHAQCYKASGKAQIAAIADIDPKKRADGRAKYECETFDTLDSLLAGTPVDIVDICLPTYLHEEGVLKAARAGKHILCEKPMALSVESCNRMIQAVRKAGVTMMIGQTVRFLPEYAAIKKMVDSRKYGKVKHVSASRLSAPADWTWQGWLFDPARSGGGIMDLHIHDIDFLNYLLGAPKVVESRGVRGCKGGFDTALTLLEFGSGVHGYAEGSIDMSGTWPFNFTLTVNCEKATIHYDMSKAPTLMVYPAKGKPFTPKLPAEKIGESSENLGNVKSLAAYITEI